MPPATDHTTFPATRRAAVRHALLSGAAESHVTMHRAHARLAALPRRARAALIAALGVLAVLYAAAAALANHEAEGAADSGCASEAASSLMVFVEQTANFLLGIGAGLSTLLFAVGGLFIIFGGTQQRVAKGMDILKNTVVGLAILAGGGFLKYVIVTFVFSRKSELPTEC